MKQYLLNGSEAGPQKDQYDLAALNEQHIVSRVLGALRLRHQAKSDSDGLM